MNSYLPLNPELMVQMEQIVLMEQYGNSLKKSVLLIPVIF